MAKDIGVKPKRITHLGSSSNSNAKSVDYIQDIMNEMDSMKHFSQHVHYENVLKSLKKKPEVVPQVTENPPEVNIHGTKLKTPSNKYHPLMAKCQKNLKILQHNRSIPKPRAHIRKISKSPLKKPRNHFTSLLSSNKVELSFNTTEKMKQKKNLEGLKKCFPQRKSDFVNHDISLLTSKKLKQKNTPEAFKRILNKPKTDCTNQDRSLHISEKVTKITSEAFKRSFPKPESDFVKSCQPVKKILKTNSFQNSKQSDLISKKIKVKNKEERKSCSISSDNDILSKCSETSTAQLSEKDTDDDFESFVQKHKPKHSTRTKTTHKRNKKSLSSSDEEDKNEKTEKRKVKKMYKNKSVKGETIKTDQQGNRKMRSASRCILEPKELSSSEQINKVNQVKWKKRETQELKPSQSKAATEKLKRLEKRTRSGVKYVMESSESESTEMYSNDICSDSSDDCTEPTAKPHLKINGEMNTSESAECKKVTVVLENNVKEKDPSAFNDLISEKDTTLGESVKKKSNRKTSVNTENVSFHSVHKEKECGDSNDSVSKKNVNPTGNVNKESNRKTCVNSESVLSFSVQKRKELGASNDLVSENNVIPEGSVNKKLHLKASVNSGDVLPLSSPCSVLTEHNDIDKKEKASSLKDCKNAAMNKTNTLPVVSNEILIELSDEEDSPCPNESDDVPDIECSSQCLLESNKQLPNLSLCANVQAENAVKEFTAPDFENCAKSKITSENDDSDVEIVEIDVHEPTFNKYNHNGVLATNSSSISPEKAKTDANVVKQLKENNLIKVSAEQVSTECKAKVPLNESKIVPLEESTKVQDIGGKLQSECTSFSVAVDSNDDEVTILETNNAEHKGNVSKGSEHVKTKPFKDEENKTVTDSCIILSDEEECKDQEKIEIGESVQSCSKSIGEVLNKEVNVLSSNDANRTEINSLQGNIPCNTAESSLTKSVIVPISAEEDCIILEPVSCVAEKLQEKDVSLKNENSKSSCDISKVNIESTEQNNKVKLCKLDCSLENNVCSTVPKDLISLNHSNQNLTVQNHSSAKSSSKGTLYLENDCIILDDAPVQVFNEEKIKSTYLHKEDMSREKLVNNFNKSATCSLPIAITEQQIQCKVKNQKISTMEHSTKCFEKSTEQSSSTEIPFVKPCVYPSNVLTQMDQTNNFVNCNLNSENSPEFKKKLQCNYAPHPTLFHDDTSSILLGNKDLQSSINLKEITLDSLNSLKTPEMKGFKLNALNELDALAESSIYELSCTGNKSIMPLLNLYKNEIGYYKKLKQTVKDVDNGIRTALELQEERLKHLAFSIQNIVQNDPCFGNSFSENCNLPRGQTQIKKENLQDEVPNFSEEGLKQSHSSKNNLFDTSSCSTLSTLGNNPCFSNSLFEKNCLPVEEQKKIKEESLHDNVPFSLAEDLKKCHSSKNNFCDTTSCSTSSNLANDPCFSNSFFEKGYLPIELPKQIKEESLQSKEPYSLAEDLKKCHSSNNNLCDVSSCSTSSTPGNEPCFSNSFFEKCYLPIEQQKQINKESLQDKVPYSSIDLKKNSSSKTNSNDVFSCSMSSALGTDLIPASNFHNESPLNFHELPQLSLESLHENSSVRVKTFEPISIKSEPLYETGEDQYFEEETKYSKSSEFQAIQPEALQELRNSKCFVCNKPAVGACYFCCSVFYCSVECSESVLGKDHRELCSEEYSKR